MYEKIVAALEKAENMIKRTKESLDKTANLSWRYEITTKALAEIVATSTDSNTINIAKQALLDIHSPKK